jgi:hypothetical protein
LVCRGGSVEINHFPGRDVGGATTELNASLSLSARFTSS